MSDLRPRGVPIIFDGVERHFLFTLNIIDELQDKYEKTLDEILEDITNEGMPSHTLRNLVVILLNDEATRAKRHNLDNPPAQVTEYDVGEMIGMDNYWEVLSAVLSAYGGSLPEPEDGGPNQASGQRSN